MANYERNTNITMKNLVFLPAFLFTFLAYSSSAQSSAGKAAIEEINACGCAEIIMIAGGVEKKYTQTWLEGIDLENDFIVFSKGEVRHLWNTNQIVFIERGTRFIRFYMNQSK
jgi:hypothetical protein